MKKFTVDHEWVSVADDIATVGITDHAQEALGDIVFVDLPQIGAAFSVGEVAAVIESVKAAGDLNSPISGEVVEINEVLNEKPNLINSSPEQDGWVFRLRVSNPAELDELMDSDAYQKFLEK